MLYLRKNQKNTNELDCKLQEKGLSGEKCNGRDNGNGWKERMMECYRMTDDDHSYWEKFIFPKDGTYVRSCSAELQ